MFAIADGEEEDDNNPVPIGARVRPVNVILTEVLDEVDSMMVNFRILAERVDAELQM